MIMGECWDNRLGLLNQISAVPAANIFSSNYQYINTFATLADIPNTIRNYKLLKRNRYLKLI